MGARGLGWRASGREDLTKKLEEMPYRSAPWRSRYPELLTLLADEPMAPKGTLIARNVCVGGQWSNIEAAATPFVTLQGNFIEEGRRLTEAALGGLARNPPRPALDLGFRPIPLEKIGLYAGPERASWPVTHPARPPK